MLHSVVLPPRFALQEIGKELGAAPVDSSHVAACGVVAVRPLAHLPVAQRLLEKAIGLLGYYPRGYNALCRRAKLLGGSLSQENNSVWTWNLQISKVYVK